MPVARSHGRLLLVALAALALATLFRFDAAAQLPQPPHLFDGNVADITVDGGPYDGVTPIEVIDSASVVVTTATVTEGVWFVQVPPDAGEIRFRIADAVSDPFPVVAGARSGDVVLTLVTPGEQPAERLLFLFPGANALAYTGVGGAVPEAIQAGLDNPAALDTIFQWDGASQSWLSWRPQGPAFLNTLTSLVQTAPLFLILSSPATYMGPLVAHGVGAWSLAPGFTAVTFLGPDGTAVEDALARVANPAAIQVLFRFNNAAGTYAVFRVDGPAFLNDLLTLNRFDVLFVLANAPTTWSFDAFAP